MPLYGHFTLAGSVFSNITWAAFQLGFTKNCLKGPKP